MGNRCWNVKHDISKYLFQLILKVNSLMEKNPKNGDYSLIWYLIHDLPFFSHTPALLLKYVNEVFKKILTLSLQYQELPKSSCSKMLYEQDFIPGSLKKENQVLVDFCSMNGRKLVFGRKTDFSETFGEPIRELRKIKDQF